ncbi:MAG: Holliday junction resolvase RuvX [Mollicutes bacterium]|jgi:putative Holliday junction resolvase|nr:Holliday junction resolvase RuvX [Mollicutes bacterium]
MKYLGLDLGSKTLGLALSDKLGLIASPYKTINYKDKVELIEELKTIIESESITKLILGFPKNMNNTIGPRAEDILKFKELLEDNLSLEIILVDERLSTKEANNYLLEGNMRRTKRKKKIDAIAASIILETYLRSENNGRK